MSMTIGRYSGTDDPDGGSIRQSGDVLSFDFDLSGSSVADMQAKVQQLRGLVDNPDETVIPFTWSEDANHDGYYTDVRVDVNDTPMALATGYSRCSISMRRLAGGFARPYFDTVTMSVLRDNVHAVATPTGIVAAYYAPTGYTWGDVELSELGTVASVGLTTSDGAVNCITKAIPLTPAVSWRGYVQPADYYSGQARIEVKYGSTWYAVPGYQIPLGVGGNWRLSNGYCRIYPSTINTASRAVSVETYRAGSWYGVEMTAFSYNVGLASFSRGDCTGTSTGYAQPAVVANRPEFAAVRVVAGSETYTFSLRAGATWVEVQRATLSNASFHAAWGLTSGVASTAFTGGVRATANDANGLRYLIARAQGGTTDAVTARIAWSNITAPPVWGITADYQAGVATTDTTVRDLFFAARSDRRVVSPR